jgi:hypothetical protein
VQSSGNVELRNESCLEIWEGVFACCKNDSANTSKLASKNKKRPQEGVFAFCLAEQ